MMFLQFNICHLQILRCGFYAIFLVLSKIFKNEKIIIYANPCRSIFCRY